MLKAANDPLGLKDLPPALLEARLAELTEKPERAESGACQSTARTEYLAAEKQARATGAGLWVDGEGAMPPWNWRSAMRDAVPVEQ